MNEAIGKAYIADESTNAKLRVQFFWPFEGDYWVIILDKDYQYAVVSEPGRQYLWILSRSPNMDKQTLEMLKDKIREKGFDLSYLKSTAR
ncbi:MAG: lipocalin family protein [Nitrospinae bacterium]|nr:lipocalin family protein [Nitrospinota bacterium]